ncbi:MAG: hypothetical protein ACREJD_12415 [Phycisphaerales bacterium]
MRHLRISAAALVSALASLPSLGGFTIGDGYLVTQIGRVANVDQPAIVRLTWSPPAATSIYTGHSMTGDGAFDSFRNRIVVVRTPAAGMSVLTLVDSSGAGADIPFTGSKDAMLAAPDGNGRIYFLRVGKISYIDSGGATHDLLNVGGSAPYSPTRTYRRMYYEPQTKSLLLGGAQGNQAVVVRLPLSADGSRLSSAPTEAMLVTPNLSTATVVGFSPGKAGKVFVKLDDNSAATGERMLMLDPVALTTTVFASSGYFGVGGETSGVYLPAFDEAVVVDTLGDHLRGYTQGKTGEGTILLTGTVSGVNAAGENATMLLIDKLNTNTCPADMNHDGFVDDADFLSFVVGYNILDCADHSMPAGCPADINKDGLVDDADFTVFVVAYNDLICP